MLVINPKGVCDAQVPVFSTVGRGPKGPQGDPGEVGMPKFSDEEWSIGRSYEALTVVGHDGDSYTAKQDVPVGIEITDTDYWAHTGSYDVQVEAYRQETAEARQLALDAQDDVDELDSKVETYYSQFTRQVNTFADLLKTTEDRVYVRSLSDGPFGFKNGCMFEVTDAYQSYIRRDDGTYMKACANQHPLQPSSAPNLALGDCIASYVGRDSLSYGSNGLFSTNVNNQIDCSAFVQACLMGVTYENSRYVKDTNVVGSYVGSNMIDHNDVSSREYGLLTWQLAEWFAEQGRLFEFPDTSEDNYIESLKLLQFGDILFSTSHSYEGRIYDIDHCMIVLKTFNDGAILVAQGGGAGSPTMSDNDLTVCKISLINFRQHHGAGKNYQVFARPAYSKVDGPTSLLLGGMQQFPHTTQGQSGSTLIIRHVLDCKLEKGKMYTLVMRGGNFCKYDTDGYYAYLRLGSSRTKNICRLWHLEIQSDYVCVPFVVANDSDIDYYNLLRLYVEESDDTPSGIEYDLDGMSIYRGVVDIDDVSKCSPLKVVDGVNVTGLNDMSNVDSNGTYHIRCEFRVPDLDGTTGFDTNIFELPDDVQNLSSTITRFMIGYNGNTHPFIMTVVSSGRYLQLHAGAGQFNQAQLCKLSHDMHLC